MKRLSKLINLRNYTLVQTSLNTGMRLYHLIVNILEKKMLCVRRSFLPMCILPNQINHLGYETGCSWFVKTTSLVLRDQA